MSIKYPNLPQNKVKLVVVDMAVSDEIKEQLQRLEIKYIVSYKHDLLLDGINTHPDMTLCHLGENKIIVDSKSFSYYNNELKHYGFNIIDGETNLRTKYPFDVSYNCVFINNCLFHNLKYTNSKILEFAKNNEYKLINVKQGYTKCSVLIVDQNATITSDIGIYKALSDNNIDALFIDSSDVKLNNFTHGFIGGTGGKIDKNTIVFYGDIKSIKEHEKVFEFLSKYQINYINLSHNNLTDYGSLIPLF